ncbi:hypothetical protein RQP46_001931 [Phenoliferia psychrophenolica]
MVFESDGEFENIIFRLDSNRMHDDVDSSYLNLLDLHPAPLSAVFPGRLEATAAKEYRATSAPLGLNPLSKVETTFSVVFACLQNKELDPVVSGPRVAFEFEGVLELEAFSSSGAGLMLGYDDVRKTSGGFVLNTNVTSALLPISLKHIGKMIDSVKPSAFTFVFTLDYTRKERHVFPIDQLASEPLRQITSHLSLLDVQHLTQAIPKLRQELIGTAASRMRCVLSPYFTDVEHFAAALDSAGAIVGGSAALSVLCPGDWSPGDIDIIVSPLGFGTIGSYLTHEGYAHDLGASKANFYPNDIKLAFQYSQWTKGDKKVDLSVSFLHTPINFLMTYHCTAVMNFFAGGQIHCLFPHLTFNGLYQTNTFTLRPDTAKFDKIEARGFAPTDPVNLQDGIEKPEGAYGDDRHAAVRAQVGEPERWMMRRTDFQHKVWRTRAAIV